MEDKTAQLPWEALKHAEGDIPWSALYKFAAEVVVDPSVVDALIELYEQTLESGYEHEHYEEFYVPAIFALSAPQLSDERRSEIGEFLVEKLAFWSEQRKGANGDGGKEPEDLFRSAGVLGVAIYQALSGGTGPFIRTGHLIGMGWTTSWVSRS